MITSSVEWDEVEDRVMLAQFLQTRAGQRLLPKVAESTPGLLPSGDVNTILIRSGEVRGWQQALQTLISLAVVQPEPEKNQDLNPSYPSLADDDAWNDGKKVTENPK